MLISEIVTFMFLVICVVIILMKIDETRDEIIAAIKAAKEPKC